MLAVSLMFALGVALAQPDANPTPAAPPPPGPPDGTEFLVVDRDTGNKLGVGWEGRFPGYVTVAFNFRDGLEATDPAKAKWPNLFYGRPTGEGALTWHPNLPVGSFTLKAESAVQPLGNQTTRIIGALGKDGKYPDITFAVREFGTLVAEVVTEKDRAGREVKKTVYWYPVGAGLTVGDRIIPVMAKTTVRFPAPGEGLDRGALYLNMAFEISGWELALPNPPAAPIQCRVSVTAFTKKKP
jgi:hypothetical protein